MRRCGVLSALLLGLAGCQSAEEPEADAAPEAEAAIAVEVPRLPTNVAEFVKLCDELSQDPKGGAAVMIVALNLYAENEDLGLSCLTVALDASRLQDGVAYDEKEPISAAQSSFKARIAGKPYVPRAYFRGTSPENGYELGDPPLVIELTDVRAIGDTAEVFVRCTGSETPRSLILKQDTQGRWKAHAWSSLEVGVRPPTQATDDDL